MKLPPSSPMNDIPSLRAAIQLIAAHASDEDFAAFMRSYTLGTMASALVEQMQPDARPLFIKLMQETYDEEGNHRQTSPPSVVEAARGLSTAGLNGRTPS